MIRRTFLKSVGGFVAHRRFAAAEGGDSAEALHETQSVDGPTNQRDFLRLARELAGEKRTVVGILDDPVFAGRAVPRDLKPSHFEDTWGTKRKCRIVRLNKYEIRSYSILLKGRMDVLVYPYGSVYPMDAFDYYTGDTVGTFLKRGGAVLTTGGVPFGMPVSDQGKSPVKGVASPPNISNQIYERWVAPLGYKYYVHPYTPSLTQVDRTFLPSVPGLLDIDGSPLGLVANNSSHDPVPKPYHGNVFPERYPARNIIPLFWGKDKYDQILAVNGIFVQDFEDGSRRIHIAHDTERHPLSPTAATFAGIMDDVFGLLANRLVVSHVETGFACYRQGETVAVTAELVAFEAPDEAEVVLEIRAGEEVVDSHTETLGFASKERVIKQWRWAPPAFEADEYQVYVSVKRQGQTVSRGQNGFVVWNENIVRSGPVVSIRGKYFHTQSEAFICGTNYYESTRGEIMWYRPDFLRVARDLRQMRSCGVNFVRPHYHHLKWFKDYLLFQQKALPPFFQSLEAVVDPLPDERVWRIWDAFIVFVYRPDRPLK